MFISHITISRPIPVSNSLLIDVLQGESPLHFAAIRGDESLFSSLLENGAFLNVQDNEGDTLLHWVVREKTEAMLAYLLKKGCSPNIPNEDGETPLHLAAALGEEFAVDCLLKHGANASLRDSEGLTPLDAALESGDSRIIQLLGKTKRATPPSRGSSSPRSCAAAHSDLARKGFFSNLTCLTPHSPSPSPFHLSPY